MLRLIGITIKQQKKKLLLVLVQFFVGFFALFYAIAMIENVLQYRERVEKLASLDTLQLIDYEEYEMGKEEKTVQRYQKSIQEILELKSIEKVGIFDKNLYELEGREDFELEGRKANKDMLSMPEWKLKKGSVEELLLYEENSEEIPVLVTEQLEKMYPCETVFRAGVIRDEMNVAYQSYKVVGVIDSGMKWWSGYTFPITDSLINHTKPYFIYPTNDNNFSLDTYGYNTLIEVTEGADLAKVKSEVVSKYEKNGIAVTTYSLSEQVEEYYRGQRTFIMTIMAFSIILLVLSVLGCNGTLLAGIMRRKEEFGIYVAMGLTKRHLSCLVFGELALLFLIAFLGAMGSCTALLLVLETTTRVSMNGRIAGTGLCVMVVAVLLSAIMPLKKVNSLQPIELVEAKE